MPCPQIRAAKPRGRQNEGNHKKSIAPVLHGGRCKVAQNWPDSHNRRPKPLLSQNTVSNKLHAQGDSHWSLHLKNLSSLPHSLWKCQHHCFFFCQLCECLWDIIHQHRFLKMKWNLDTWCGHPPCTLGVQRGGSGWFFTRSLGAMTHRHSFTVSERVLSWNQAQTLWCWELTRAHGDTVRCILTDKRSFSCRSCVSYPSL